MYVEKIVISWHGDIQHAKVYRRHTGEFLTKKQQKTVGAQAPNSGKSGHGRKDFNKPPTGGKGKKRAPPRNDDEWFQFWKKHYPNETPIYRMETERKVKKLGLGGISGKKANALIACFKLKRPW